MYLHIRLTLGLVGIIMILTIFILGFRVGGSELLPFGIYAPLLGALCGGILVLVSVNTRIRPQERVEPWLEHEKLAWTFIGWGCIAWGIGECFWRYNIAHGLSPFPSMADAGYISFFPLVFLGLILLPFSVSSTSRRVILLLDSLIAMGALLSIAWSLLLGFLAHASDIPMTAKILSLYYITTDIALLSCTAFWIFRERDLAPARRIGLLFIGIGLSLVTASDFFFNVLQNVGVEVDGTWVDLGWPLGMLMIGFAAYLRRFWPAEEGGYVIEGREKWRFEQTHFGLPQVLPYILLVILLLVLTLNVLVRNTTQPEILPVLTVATFAIVVLVVIRQIITMYDNKRLMQEQMSMFQQLEQVHRDTEQRQTELETGVAHLKAIQARLANGDVRARAHTLSGELWPLARGLNLMADRMMRSEQGQKHAQQMIRAIDDLNYALEQERRESDTPFVLPASCLDAPPALLRFLQIAGAGSGTRHFPRRSSVHEEV